MPLSRISAVQVDTFTDRPFRGNPALVLFPDSGVSEDQLRSVISEAPARDIALYQPERSGDIRLRYFLCGQEVQFIGHATIAAYIAAVERGILTESTLRQRCADRVLDLTLDCDGPRTWVTLEYPAPPLSRVLTDRERAQLLDAFNIPSRSLDPACPPQIGGNSLQRLLVGIRSANDLADVTANPEALAGFPAQLGVGGFFFFVRGARGPGTCESRLFAVSAHGIAEDPVSGNAHGLLGTYLFTHGMIPIHYGRAMITGNQGRYLGREGEVRVQISGNDRCAERVSITGTGRVVYEGAFIL